MHWIDDCFKFKRSITQKDTICKISRSNTVWMTISNLLYRFIRSDDASWINCWRMMRREFVGAVLDEFESAAVERLRVWIEIQARWWSTLAVRASRASSVAFVGNSGVAREGTRAVERLDLWELRRTSPRTARDSRGTSVCRRCSIRERCVDALAYPWELLSLKRTFLIPSAAVLCSVLLRPPRQRNRRRKEGETKGKKLLSTWTRIVLGC